MTHKELEEIKNIEVRKEAFKLLEIFEEGFLNSELELVICHPINPVDICNDFDYKVWHGRGRNVYCNVYFNIGACKNKLEVQRNVLEYWSREASKAMFAGKEVNEVIHEYIRNGINEYLKTNFTAKDMELIYEYLGNGINHSLCEKFIESKYDMKLLGKETL